jgi:transcriptional regulator with XRE-family HTH domain
MSTTYLDHVRSSYLDQGEDRLRPAKVTGSVTPFAAKLRALRETERIRVTELARMYGGTTKDVQRFQTGVSPVTHEPFVPSVAVIRRLAHALATDPVRFDRWQEEVVDDKKERRYFRELMEAAGYLDSLTAVETKLPPSVVQILREHPEITGVYLERDADEWTAEAEQQFLEALEHAIGQARKGLPSKERASAEC